MILMFGHKLPDSHGFLAVAVQAGSDLGHEMIQSVPVSPSIDDDARIDHRCIADIFDAQRQVGLKLVGFAPIAQGEGIVAIQRALHRNFITVLRVGDDLGVGLHRPIVVYDCYRQFQISRAAGRDDQGDGDLGVSDAIILYADHIHHFPGAVEVIVQAGRDQADVSAGFKSECIWRYSQNLWIARCYNDHHLLF